MASLVDKKVPISLDYLEDLSDDQKKEIFNDAIQPYVQYPEELKEKAQKMSMKIISHTWRTYKSRLVKCLKEDQNPFEKFKELKEEDWEQFVDKCKSTQFSVESEYMQWLRSQNELNHHLGPTGYAGKKASGSKRMREWPSRVLRIPMPHSLDGWHHICVLGQNLWMIVLSHSSARAPRNWLNGP